MPCFSAFSKVVPDTGIGFTPENFEKFLLKSLNNWRQSENLDTFELNPVLFTIAEHHSAYMSITNKLKPDEEKKKYKTIGDRSIAYGGTKKVEELIYSFAVNSGGTELQANALVETTINKWKESKKERPTCLNPKHIFIGISCKLEKSGKKAYLSIVFGDYSSFNTGASKRKTLKVPYTKKAKKIKLVVNEAKECKSCEKFKDYYALINGLFVNNKNEIVLSYPNLKELRKILKKSKDGFAVDIVQKAQYTNKDYNVIDFNLINKGVVLKKPTYTQKIISKNKAAADKKGKATALEVVLGKVPKKLTNDCEINLMILQDGKVCKTLTKTYIDQGDQASNSALGLLLMPDSDAYLNPKFKPTAESTILNFPIFFAKNKSDYKEADIKPMLDALKEPDYKVEGIYIYAYSSIEGDSIANTQLQKKRAESIITTFKQMNKTDLSASVKTNDSWDLFRLEMDGTSFNYLTEIKKKEAIKKINSDKILLDSLEPYLSKQRFAQVILDITYDIKGDKEYKYTVALLNKAISKNDTKIAYKIQYFLEEAVREKKYPESLLSKVEIPRSTVNSGLLNNQIVYGYLRNGKKFTDKELTDFTDLAKLDLVNPTVKFNHVLATLKTSELKAEKNFFDQLQVEVNSLYNSTINKKKVDALNTELQFKFMEAYDTMPNNSAVMETCMNRIKSFYNYKEEGSWENSLKLAYAFSQFYDFRFATSILEPFITKQGAKPDEKLLFAYMSYCAQLPDKINSKGFAAAAKLAKELYPTKFCSLVGQPYMTFQILDNPDVKQSYVECGCLN